MYVLVSVCVIILWVVGCELLECIYAFKVLLFFPVFFPPLFFLFLFSLFDLFIVVLFLFLISHVDVDNVQQCELVNIYWGKCYIRIPLLILHSETAIPILLYHPCSKSWDLISISLT